MENRYLFKGKRIDNGEWEVGSLVILPDKKVEICNRAINPPDSDPMWGRCVVTHYVDPNTICQCTGLRDKNGNLIWENDIVKGKYLNKGKLYRLIGEIKYACQAYRIEGVKQYKGYYAELDKTYEVIGNVFDNPKLLKNELENEDEYDLEEI